MTLREQILKEVTDLQARLLQLGPKLGHRELLIQARSMLHRTGYQENAKDIKIVLLQVTALLLTCCEGLEMET